jgi:transcriptional regulator with XRE-family HTH domain
MRRSKKPTMTNLGRVMEERGIKAKGLATRLGEPSVSASTVRRWKIGEATPDAEELGRLSRVLGVPVSYLADNSDGRSPQEVMMEASVLEIIGRIGWVEAYDRLVGARPPGAPIRTRTGEAG